MLNREEIIHIEESEDGNEELENLVLTATEDAVILLKQMRMAEGEELKKDLLAFYTIRYTILMNFKNLLHLLFNLYKERLTKRMQEFVHGQFDETRILTEVAIFADKADINEEITRLKSHIQQFIQTL